MDYTTLGGSRMDILCTIVVTGPLLNTHPYIIIYIIYVCKQLDVPLEPGKQHGPTTSIVVLGILIDTVKQELRFR